MNQAPKPHYLANGEEIFGLLHGIELVKEEEFFLEVRDKLKSSCSSIR